MAEAHGGRKVVVDSLPGTGATFTIDIPRATAGGGRQMTGILIAEDEARLAALLEKGLQANGFLTTVAGDRATALALARDEGFGLLVLGPRLPALDGLSALCTMGARAGGCPS
jgi:PleD family two-component response regulator